MISPHGVYVLDKNGRPISDSIGHSLTVVDIDHYLIHMGKTWIKSNTATVNSGANLDFLIINGAAGDLHVKEYSFSSSQANSDIIIYDTPTTTANGTQQTLQNKNRNHQGDTPQSALYISPTVTAVGTALEYSKIIGSKTTGGSVVGGGDEWVIPANGVFLLRYTNNAALADVIDYSIKMLDIGTL